MDNNTEQADIDNLIRLLIAMRDSLVNTSQILGELQAIVDLQGQLSARQIMEAQLKKIQNIDANKLNEFRN